MGLSPVREGPGEWSGRFLRRRTAGSGVITCLGIPKSHCSSAERDCIRPGGGRSRGFRLVATGPGKPVVERPNGSKIEFDTAKASGANFLGSRIRAALQAPATGSPTEANAR